ncbi:uncharacterized protein AAG666_002161 [Megaptera novaeangliae]
MNRLPVPGTGRSARPAKPGERRKSGRRGKDGKKMSLRLWALGALPVAQRRCFPWPPRRAQPPPSSAPVSGSGDSAVRCRRGPWCQSRSQREGSSNRGRPGFRPKEGVAWCGEPGQASGQKQLRPRWADPAAPGCLGREMPLAGSRRARGDGVRPHDPGRSHWAAGQEMGTCGGWALGSQAKARQEGSGESEQRTDALAQLLCEQLPQRLLGRRPRSAGLGRESVCAGDVGALPQGAPASAGCSREAGRRRTVAGALLEGRPAPAPRRAGEGGSGCMACPALLRGTSSTSGGPGAGTEGSAEAGVSPVGEDLVTEQSSPGKAGAAGRQGAVQGKWRDPRLCLGWVS